MRVKKIKARIYINLLNSAKQKFQYFVTLWLFVNQLNSSNCSCRSITTVNK